MFPKICSNNLSTKNSGKILPNSEETFYAKKNRKISTKNFQQTCPYQKHEAQSIRKKYRKGNLYQKTWKKLFSTKTFEEKPLPFFGRKLVRIFFHEKY